MRKLLYCIMMLFSIAFDATAKIHKSYGYAIYSELKYPENFEHFEYANPDAPKGGSIKFAQVGSFDSINPYSLKGTKAPGIDTYIYDCLLVRSGDELNSYYGLLAETLEYPDDKSWVVFNLRKEAKWPDGTPITAHDLAFSLETLREKGNPNYKLILKDVGHAEVLGDFKIKYHFLDKDDHLLIPIVGELPVIQKAFFKDKELDKFEGLYPNSGPYKIKNYSLGKSITFERIPTYWAKDLPVYKGLYNFDIVHFDIYMEDPVAIEALKAEAYDYREENVSKYWANAYNGKIFQNGSAKRELLKHKLPAGLQAFFFNMRRPPFDDIALRKAISYAYDFDWINKNLLYRLYNRHKSYFENTEYAATGIPEGKELEILKQYADYIPKEALTEEFVVPETGATYQGNRENLRIAKQTLLDAGYTFEGGKLISPATKKPVEIEMIYHFQGFERIYLAMKENLAKIGITLKLHLIDFAQYQLRIKKFDFDMVGGAFTPSTFPGRNQEQLWDSRATKEGEYNLSGVKSKAVDEVINKIINAEDKEELLLYSKVLDRILLWNYYAIPQLYSHNFRLVYWNKFNRPKIRPAYGTGVEAWWAK